MSNKTYLLLRLALALTIFCLTPGVRAAGGAQVDVCVYGGTSGGAIAAVAAARLGKSVVLVCQNGHVGGMTSSGLGVTDVGNYPSSIGGIAAEFYARVGQAYGSSNSVYWFEPHVAEQTFLQMLSQAGVSVFTNEQLASVTMSNLSITQVTMTDGSVYLAKEFIDATYEGDLMAQAGVSYTWGREGTNVYGESLAGVVINSVAYPCDPYVVPGNPASGLLPLIQSNAPGNLGAGDQRVQTYNFRLCLTQNPTNQIPITAPTNYSEATYQLVARYINSYVATNGGIVLEDLIDVQQLIPNNKTDINANGDVSSDYVGYNYTYPTNTPQGRQTIYQQHKNYISGLLYYLAHSTNVPVNVQTNMQSFGYAMDEFQDNGGWPYLMYIREARRMVSDYVMLQQDALGLRAAADSIALGNYTLDCHPAARLAINGVSRWEGAIGTSIPEPYPISYRSIVPSVGQCSNLFVTFGLSASHVGFASVRTEPTFMMLSQSAGTAAAFAIDDNVAAQQVSYAKLSAELLADKQILSWNSVQPIATNGIILTVTNTSGISYSSGWGTGANPGGWPLPNGTYLLDQNSGKGTKWVRFTPNLASAGYYGVYVWWVYANNRATNTPFTINSPGGATTVLINEQNLCSNWVQIASSNYFNAGSGGNVTISNTGTSGYVVANAVRFVPLGGIATPPTPVVEIVASDAVASEFGGNTGRFSVVLPNGAVTSPVTVNYTVGGTAQAGVDYLALPGNVTIPAGAVATNILVVPRGDSLAANQASVVVTLVSSTNYVLTNLSAATVQILDRPINTWLRSNFTMSQLANPAISGDAADPANDGLPNLVKYALGLNPNLPAPNPFAPAVANPMFTVTYPLSLSATDVSLGYQYSTDLLNWVPGATQFQALSTNFQVTNQWITIGSTATNPIGFIRFYGTRR
jgi:hypothetical protein